MKIEIENLEGNFKKLHIEISPEIVDQHFAKQYRELQKNAELKGFRKGKAPLDVIKKLYGSNVSGYVAQSLVETHLFEALTEKTLEPVGTPKVEVGTVLAGVPFKFSAHFEQMPVIELKDYKSLKLKKEEVTADPAEVQKTLENLQSQLATLENAEGKAANGLVAGMDYDASEAGLPVPEASEKDGSVELGAGQLFEGFEKNIIGMSVGETKSFSVKFPMPEKEEEKTPVSGRTIDFTVTLKTLQKKVLPEMNDDFAKKLGPFQGFEDLKNRIIEDLKKNKEQNQLREHQEKYVDWLIEQNPVTAPETMLNAQMEQLAMDAGSQLSRAGLDEKAIEERLKTWSSEMTDRATRQVKASLLLGVIGQKENIQVGDEDLRKELVRIAVQSGKNPKEIWEEMQEKGLARGFLRQISELKALDWAVSQALQT